MRNSLLALLIVLLLPATAAAAVDRPGVAEIRQDGTAITWVFGNGSYTFPRVSNPIPGTYRATVSGGGESASATTSVSGSSEAPAPDPQPEQPEQPQQNPAGPEVGGGTDCNNPQSQDEIDLCGG